MASNKELIEQAVVLATALGLTVETEGLNNAKLTELVKDLKAKKKDADTESGADEAEARAKAEAEGDDDDVPPPFSIAPGKALTTKRGLLGPGEEIKADDLAGGKKALTAFVKSKHVIKA